MKQVKIPFPKELQELIFRGVKTLTMRSEAAAKKIGLAHGETGLYKVNTAEFEVTAFGPMTLAVFLRVAKLTPEEWLQREGSQNDNPASLWETPGKHWFYVFKRHTPVRELKTSSASKLGAYVYPVNPQAVILAKSAYTVDDPFALSPFPNYGILTDDFWKNHDVRTDAADLTLRAFRSLHGGQRVVPVGTQHGKPVYLWMVGDPSIDSKMSAKNLGGFQLTPIAPEEWKDFITLASPYWKKGEAIQLVVPTTPVDGRFVGAELQKDIEGRKLAGDVNFQGDSSNWYGASLGLRSIAHKRFLARSELVKSAKNWRILGVKHDAEGKPYYKPAGPGEYYTFDPPSFADLIAHGHPDMDLVQAKNEELTVRGYQAEQEALLSGEGVKPKVPAKGEKRPYEPKTEGIPWRAVRAVVAVVYGRPKGKGGVFGPISRTVIQGANLPDRKEKDKRGLTELLTRVYQSIPQEPELAAFTVAMGVVVDITQVGDAPKEKKLLEKGVAMGDLRAVMCNPTNAWVFKKLVKDGEVLDRSRMTAASLNEFKNRMLFEDLLGCGFKQDGLLFRPLGNLFEPARVQQLAAYQKRVKARAEDGKGPPEVQSFLHFEIFPKASEPSDVVVAARGAGDALGRADLYGGPRGTVRLRAVPGSRRLEEYAPAGVHAVRDQQKFSKFIPFALELSLLKANEDRPEAVVIHHKIEKSPSPVSSDVFALLRSRGVPHPPESSDWTDPNVRAAMEKAILHLKTFLYADQPAQGQLKKEKHVETEEWRQKLLRANPQAARRNPLTGSDQAKAVEEWIRSEGKADNQVVENIFEELRKKSPPASWKLADLEEDPRTKKPKAAAGSNVVESLFPRKGNLHDYKPEKRVPALEKHDLIARVDYPALTGPQRDEEVAEQLREEKQIATSTTLRPQTLDYLLKQAELSLVDTQRVMAGQRATRESKFTMQSSTALLKDFKIRRLQKYTPPPEFLRAGGPNKIVIVISPVADRAGRVMTFRRNHHLDLDVAPQHPKDLSLGKLVGKALMSALLWIAENPSRRASNTAIYVTRVGAGFMTLAWQPGDELTLGAIASRLKKGDGPPDRWDGVADEHMYMSALSDGRRVRRRYRDDLYEQESVRVAPVDAPPETQPFTPEEPESRATDWDAFYGLSPQDVASPATQDVPVTPPEKKARAPRKPRKKKEEAKENPSFWKRLFSW